MDELIARLPQLLTGGMNLIAAWLLSKIAIFIWRLIFRKMFKKGLTKPYTLSDSIGIDTVPLMMYCVVFLYAFLIVFGILGFEILRPIESFLQRLLSSPTVFVFSLSGISAVQILYLNGKRKAET